MKQDPAALLQTFNRWIGSIPRDAEALKAVALHPGVPRPARRILVGGLDYLPRQFDLIPDHFAGIGALDDAFVLRLSAMLAFKSGLGDIGTDEELGLQRLADEAQAVRSFLGDAYPLLVAYVVRLPDLSVRGRDADRVIDDEHARDQFLRELRRDLAEPPPAALSDPAALEEVRSLIREKCTRALPGSC